MFVNILRNYVNDIKVCQPKPGKNQDEENKVFALEIKSEESSSVTKLSNFFAILNISNIFCYIKNNWH